MSIWAFFSGWCLCHDVLFFMQAPRGTVPRLGANRGYQPPEVACPLEDPFFFILDILFKFSFLRPPTQRFPLLFFTAHFTCPVPIRVLIFSISWWLFLMRGKAISLCKMLFYSGLLGSLSRALFWPFSFHPPCPYLTAVRFFVNHP